MAGGWGGMKNSHKFVMGCAIGNLLEWYDFILFGFFAQLFSTLFFPKESAFVALLLTFMVFASGCLIRPLASIAFGHLGDTVGRKKALIITIVLITLATTLMGLLPTYSQVGALAPVLLIFCRLIQGVAVSGEEMGAAILLAENAPENQQAFMGSIVLSSVYGGLFLGAVSVLLVHLFCTEASLAAWGWRIPFLASSLLGILAFKLRMQAMESEEFEKLQVQKKTLKLPFKKLMATHKTAMFKSTMLCAILAVAIYLFAVYLPSYYSKFAGFSSEQSLMISALFLLVASLLVPYVGFLADKKGCVRFMRIGCWGFLIFSYPIFALLAEHTLLSTTLAESILVIFLSCIAGSLLPIIIHSFPVEIRYSGVSLSFNISMTVFGSTAPIVALLLQKFFHSEMAPALYLIVAAFVSLLVLPKRKRTNQSQVSACNFNKAAGEC
jgi:MFS family permease